MKALLCIHFVFIILFSSCTASARLQRSEPDDLYYHPSCKLEAKGDTAKGSITEVDKYIYTSSKGKFYQGDVKLSFAALPEIVRPVPDAYQNVQKGRTLNTIGWVVLAGIGPAFFGFGIAGNLFDVKNEPNNIYVLEGLADLFVLTGYIISRDGVKKISKGVQIYNSSLKPGGNANTSSIIFGLTKGGIGLTLKF